MSMHHTVVVGGGLAGLTVAYDLMRAGRKVTVLEATGFAGGVMSSVRQDGFLFEEGPNTIQASARAFRFLASELGLDSRLVASRPEAQERYIHYKGKLHTLPSNPLTLLASGMLGTRAKLGLAKEALRKKPTHVPTVEPDLATFLIERFGEEATRVIAGAFVRGVYASEVWELGTKSAFPAIWNLAQEHGSLVKGMKAAKKARESAPKENLPGPEVERTQLLSFPEGLGEMTYMLASQIGSWLTLDSEVKKLFQGDDGKWFVTTNTGTIEADAVVLATPAHISAELLRGVASDQQITDPLASIEHASVTLVHMGLSAASLGKHWKPGFGYLVPPPGDKSSERRPSSLGTLFPSNLFSDRAPAGAVSTTTFYNSADVSATEDVDCARQAMADLGRGLNLESAPELLTWRVRRWPQGIPKYGVGHADKVSSIRNAVAQTLPGLTMIGNWMHGVSVENVIASSRGLARSLLSLQPAQQPQRILGTHGAGDVR